VAVFWPMIWSNGLRQRARERAGGARGLHEGLVARADGQVADAEGGNPFTGTLNVDDVVISTM